MLIAGRINDTYGTPFYGSNGDKIDLALLGYTPVENTLLYAFDYKAVEGKNENQNGTFGANSNGAGKGDFDAYGFGGQVTLDKLLVGGRYVYLQNNTETQLLQQLLLQQQYLLQEFIMKQQATCSMLLQWEKLLV